MKQRHLIGRPTHSSHWNYVSSSISPNGIRSAPGATARVVGAVRLKGAIFRVFRLWRPASGIRVMQVRQCDITRTGQTRYIAYNIKLGKSDRS